MLKLNNLFLSLSITSLFLALLIILAHLTQAANIQIIPIQSLYWSLDKIWGIERALANLIIAIIASAIAILATRKLIESLTFEATGLILILTIGGLFLGLACQYTYRCCDSPVILLVGFPMSWGHGAMDDFNGLSSSIIGGYLQHLIDAKWYINPWGLITDLLFWFNASFIFLTMPKFKQTK